MEASPKRILIADDEPDILEIISYNLTREGYIVQTAKDGDEALSKAKVFRPELIILDIMMPKKTGIEVCTLLRQQPAFRDTLIIFLTALNDETSHIRGLETGADDYISKPISPKVLLSKVTALFRRLKPESGLTAIRTGAASGPLTATPSCHAAQPRPRRGCPGQRSSAPHAEDGGQDAPPCRADPCRREA